MCRGVEAEHGKSFETPAPPLERMSFLFSTQTAETASCIEHNLGNLTSIDDHPMPLGMHSFFSYFGTTLIEAIS